MIRINDEISSSADFQEEQFYVGDRNGTQRIGKIHVLHGSLIDKWIFRN